MQGLSQNLQQSLELRQYQIQRLEILSMSSDELADFLNEARLENPLLEMEPDQSELEKDLSVARWLNVSSVPVPRGYQNPEEPLELDIPDQRGETLEGFLRLQIDFHHLTPQRRRMVNFLLGNLENNGRLPLTAAEAAQYSGGTVADAEAALSLLRGLAPAGVCAASLRDCLLTQLQALSKRNLTAERLVSTCLNAVASSSVTRLAQRCKVNAQQITAALATIRSLEPYPGSSFYKPPVQSVVPDMAAFPKEDGSGWDVQLCSKQSETVSISSYYVDLLKGAGDPESSLYLHNRLRQAKELSIAIEQRRSTLLRIGRLIVERQQPYFDRTGPLQTLCLTDLAEKLECHESTVSRALRGKYIACPWGTVALRKFVSASVGNSGVTNDSLEQHLQRLIDNEDKRAPLSDQHLTAQLARDGMNVSRRTVAKYRSILGIPNAFARRVSE